MGINSLWQEGRTIDLWSIDHFLAGVAFASFLSHFPLSFGWSVALAVALFVGWEIGEKLVGVRETWPNILVDVVLDLAGFLAVAWPVTHYEYRHSWPVTIAILVVFNTFNAWGFLAYRRRTGK